MKDKICRIILYCLYILFSISCIEKNVYKDVTEEDQFLPFNKYLYPYYSEVQNVVAEIIIETEVKIDPKKISVEIPPLKYNKTWLFMLTQDDCMHAAYSTTWAAINGKPLSNRYYYSAEQLAALDLPPDHFYLDKTLGYTDGTGKEIRFAFTTTLAPELDWMNNESIIDKGASKDNYRFFMKSGLTWNNLSEMLAYGTGIAFHDVNTKFIHNEDSILNHYELSQKIILNQLAGRGCKVLAEPNGNKSYVNAAAQFADIQIIMAQNSGASGSTPLDLFSLYPFKVQTDLHKSMLKRYFFETSFDIVGKIESELQKNKEDREAIHLGVHGTYATFVDFLVWLNNKYGKDGDDSVWFPSFEEYYEYNYNRSHSTVLTELSDNQLKLTVTLPSAKYFYFPSITINLSNIDMSQIVSVETDDNVTGLSYDNFDDGLMLNLDFRKYLVEHATYFVNKSLSYPLKSNKDDAFYFTNLLKESSIKSELLEKLK